MAQLRKSDKVARTQSAKVAKPQRATAIKQATSRVSATGKINFRQSVRKG